MSLKLLNIHIPRTSIRLNAMVVLEIVLLLFLSLTVLLYFSYQTLKEEAFQEGEETLESTVQHIDNILMNVEQTAYNVYQELQENIDRPERMLTFCREIAENNPYVTGCAIAFKPYFYKDRELFMSYIHKEGVERGTYKLVARATYGNRPYTEQEWYSAPMKTGHASWTDPFVEEGEEEVILTLCIPIYARHAKAEARTEKDILGVLGVDVPIAQLSQIILDLKPLPHSYSVLLGHNGTYIVHPDAEKLSRRMTVADLAANSADSNIREAAEAMLAGNTGRQLFHKDGKQWCVFYKPFSRSWSTKAAELGAKEFGIPMEKLKWSAGLVYLKDDVIGNYNILVYLVLAITIVGVLTFYFLSRMVIRQQMRPLRMLNQSAQRIIGGDYHEKIPSTEREDEIGRLQNNFQRMQQSLADKSEELRKMTATLTQRSEELRKAYNKTTGSDRMKTTFLHYMTQHMVVPSDLIERSITKVSNNYSTISPAEAEYEVSVIKQQSDIILDLLDHMIEALEIEKEEERKEVANE